VLIAGIDPGFSGGVALLTPSGKLDSLHLMPVVKGPRGGSTELDLVELKRLLTAHAVDVVVLERVHAMKGWGEGAAWRFGVGWGQIQGVVVALGLSLLHVAPDRWQKTLLHGTTGAKGDKTAAIAEALRRWPGVDLKPGKRTKHHDGLADALLIAEWGRRELLKGGAA
jgi:crossover junction endodeoxyribonuclease RuvC